MLLSSRPAPLPPPDRRYCLFLDFDGTLVNLAPTPDAVARDETLVSLLRDTARGLEGAVAIVSGRRIDAVDALIAPLVMPVAGVHGYERRSASGMIYRPTANPARHLELRARLAEFVAGHERLLLEDKGVSFAIHFRSAPYLGARVHEFMLGLSQEIGEGLELLEGNRVLELKPSIHNKATAVEAFLQEAPFAGRTPIYIGDDTTDTDGFAAVGRHDGMAIAVGSRVSTPWRLKDPDAVRFWLEDFNMRSVRAAEHQV